MASYFTLGERKARPGSYYRYENDGPPPAAGADDGKSAALFVSDWGPLGKPSTLSDVTEVEKIYGKGGASGSTYIPVEQFKGGARQVAAMRLGSPDSCIPGTYQIMDESSPSKAVIQMTMLHPGSRKFQVTVRPSLRDEGMSELLLLDGSAVLERFSFITPPLYDDDDGDGQLKIDHVDSLMEAVESEGSKYFKLTKISGSLEALAQVEQDPVTPGSDPSIDVAAYSDAMETLEAYRWNVFSVDTADPAVHSMARMYLNRVCQSGKFVMGVFAESSSVKLEDRLKHAAAFNDYQIVYVGNGLIGNDGAVFDGPRAAARVAGMIAGTPSNRSITHMGVPDMAEVHSPLSNYDYERSILAGMLTFSADSAGRPWIEQGINTLHDIKAGADEDEGWKKIKRTKIRFELFQRLSDTTDRLIGGINNDDDGRMTVIQACNGICNLMVSEGKLLAGSDCELSQEIAPEGDSAWFNVYADDIDSLEKSYFTFKFRFSPGE